MKIKLLSLFSGIGAFEKALDNLEINFDLLAYSEIDKYASRVFSEIHNVPESKNLGDISNIEVNESFKETNLVTWGFPCQDFSVANRNGQLGLKGEQSGLYYKGLDIVEQVNPQISIIENVNSLKGDQLQVILDDLKSLGYENHFKVLDAQDYGLPQRRKRLFIISLKNYSGFSFPNPVKLGESLDDYLSSNVRDKYYKVNSSILDRIKDKSNTFTLGNNNKVVCNTITKALARQGSSKEFILNCSLIYNLTGDIRRMTPLETWKLTGFEIEDYKKGKKVLENEFYNGRDMSDTRMYNMAANSIAVPVLEQIFKELFIENKEERNEV